MQKKILRWGITLCVFTAITACAQQYGRWSDPENVGSTINSPWIEEAPFLSRDGLQLYFSSDRPGGYGGSDIWMAKRPYKGADWGLPVNLGPNVNTADNENHPTLTADGHMFFFDRLPAGGGTYDMFWSRRRDKSDVLGWGVAVNAGPCINTPANDSAMIFFEDDTTGTAYTYFNSNRTGNPEMYVTIYHRKAPCTPVLPVVDLNTSYVERNATIRHNGLEILFESTRPGSNGFDIWTAKRASISDPWSQITNTTELNSPFYDGRPALSWDGTELYFFTNRDGGNFDLYVSRREKLNRK